MGRPTKAATESKSLSRRVLVNVRRDAMTQTPRVIWQHELPILEQIFGEGTVSLAEVAKLDEGYKPQASREMLIYNKKQDASARPSESVGIGYVFTGDPRAEYERLAATYGRHAEVNVSLVEHVYGRFQEGRFAAVVGVADLDDMPDGQLREFVTGHDYLPMTSKDSSDAEMAEFDRKAKELRAMNHEQLVALAEELAGVTA